MKTKAFDLQAALAGATIVTRDGRKVRNIKYVGYPINATIENPDGTEHTTNYTKDGRYFWGKSVSPRDLLILVDEGGEE